MWGATHPFTNFIRNSAISTHTPHVGCDMSEQQPLVKQNLFQLTHPMWGATMNPKQVKNLVCISTHTPHVGCDMQMLNFTMTMKISTHTPHVGCDPCLFFIPGKNIKFQLTHPMWGATSLSSYMTDSFIISTHTPHVGCDNRGRK